ncbi:glycolate oxidase iron-sulfur subunit [Natronospira proteinivora]|uniref:Glycolate oxidase iron-sulfur subunit n=1 Tax=Natronospira proteinivora TaxID=1807133 RepID=A0ABT1G9F9_9GAMM|nr:(Fe-S)-binding protein [Natronospira proteinivora]MCP1727540.1 glycolate oxidase iron-sulfur subunit [Natronospira proteinivora]
MTMVKPNPDGNTPSHRPPEADKRWEFPLADADQCVKCALCLPHCPTYRETRDENESPRGRIALMQGLARDELTASDRLATHLDRCLGCRNCEPVCPANVPYGRLIDSGRRLLAEKGRRIRPTERMANVVLTRPSLLWMVSRLGWIYQASGMKWLAERSILHFFPKLNRLSRLLPPTRWRRQGVPKTAGRQDRGSVQLFLGCVADELDPGVSRSAKQLLEAAGYAVSIPSAQGCCGAPAQHGGQASQSRRLAQRNLAAFNDKLPVIATASGCTATLQEYAEIEGSEDHHRFQQQVWDICQFLDGRVDGLSFEALPSRAVLYLPCSQRNVVGGSSAIIHLLKRIPELDIITPETKGECCGAAGSYLVRQPELSDQLGRRAAEGIEAQKPDLLLTTNIGCKLQLRAQLKVRGLDCEILHPVELLARQLAI